MKFGAWHSLARHKRAVRESFLCENRLFHQSTKVFSLKSFPLYGTRTQTTVGGLFLADNSKFMAALFLKPVLNKGYVVNSGLGPLLNPDHSKAVSHSATYSTTNLL